MKNRDMLTKILAITGTIFSSIPLLAPMLFSGIRFLRGNSLLFDYLMPAELFPLYFAGGGLCLWAGLRIHSHWRPIAWSVGIGVALLFSSQILAVATGLADGRIDPVGWPWLFVLSLLMLTILAIISTIVSGIVLIIHIFKNA